ncbi:MAG TPA: hypothetical protein VFG72_07865 [Marmoricola sp.]|nr:hypothetical protein [Marmoricola sp.]
MAANPLVNIFGPATRARLYAIYAVAGLLIGSVQAGYSAVADRGVEVPAGIQVALAVYAYLGIALGFTAASNVSEKKQQPELQKVPG